MLSFAAPAHADGALPSGGNFAAGAGDIAQSTNALTVNQASQRAIINWQNFSIGQGNSVQINNGAGATLNRVISNAPSTIAGSLRSTGSTYIVNQNGIIVTPTGKVVTGGSFVGSTRDTSNSDFMAGGAQQFTGTSNGSVVNQGTIKAANGDAVLVGKSVSNSGKLLAPKGTAGLAAGDDVVLQPSDSGLQIQVKAGSGDVTNSGTVAGAQAALDAAGGNVYALAGNNGGVVKATGTAKIAGHVWLTAGGEAEISGKVAAHNQDGSGGTVTVSATDITLPGLVNVSAKSATGSGGNITIKASQNAKVSGSLKAAAGAAGGDGGQIETSGELLDTSGISIDAASPKGLAGIWLLDPYNLNVVATASTATQSPTGTWTSNAGGSNVLNTDINAVLNSGTSVVLQTSGTLGDGFGNGDITVSAAITKSAGTAASLTLKAAGSIIVNAGISATSGLLNVTLDANTLGGGGYVNVAAGIMGINTLVIGGGANPLTGAAVGTAVQGAGVLINAGIVAATITITGTGGNVAAGSNYGVQILNSINGVGVGGFSGVISITGTGGIGGSNNTGILQQALVSTTGVGTITLVGTGGASPGSSNHGISQQASITTAGGNITLNGTGGSGSVSDGYLANSSGNILANGGNVAITGTASAAANSGYGYQTGGNSVSTSGLGTITIAGTSRGNSASIVYGIDSGGTISAVGGLISITGTNSSAGVSGGNYGVNVSNTITSSGLGGISLTGFGGGATGSSSNYGVTWTTANLLQATGGGAITITGTGGGTGGSGSFNFGVAAQGLAGSGGAISITGTGGGNSVGNTNYGIFQGAGTISNTGTGTITLSSTTKGFSAPSGISLLANGVTAVNGLISVTAVNQSASTAAGQDGINLTAANAIVSTGSGGVSLTGTAGGTGAGGSDYGVTWSAGSIAFGSGPITITGTGGDAGGTGNNNYGVYVQTALAGSGGAISITGTGGNASGIGNTGINQTAAISNGGTGSITLNGTGSGTGGGGIGYNPSANVTAGTGNIVITGNGSAVGFGANNYGILASGGTISTAGAGTITLSGTGTGAGIGTAVSLPANGVKAVDGLISITGINHSIAAASGQDGLNLTAANTVVSTGSGGVSLTGTGGGSSNSGSDYGVTWSAGSISFGNGPITITGTGGDAGGTGTNNYGVNITQAVAGGGAPVSITGTGGNSSGSGNYGVNQSAAISNSGAGSITLSGTGGGSGSTEYGYVEFANITAVTGNIAITGIGSATASLSRGISLMTGAISTGGSGTVTLNGSGSGSGNASGIITGPGAGGISAVDGLISLTGLSTSTDATSGDYGINISAGTIASSGLGGISISGTAGGAGAGNSNVGVLLSVFNGVQSTGAGPITIAGTGGGNGGSGSNNYGVSILQTVTGSGGAISITGTGGNSSGGGNFGINRSGAVSNSGTGSITLTGTGGGSGGSDIGYFSNANATAGTGNIVITGTGSAAGQGSTNYGIDISAGTTSTTGAGTITLSGTAAGSGVGTAVLLSANAVKAVDGLISITGINNSTGTGAGQHGLSFTNGANSVVSTGTGGVSLTGTAGGTGAALGGGDYGVTWAPGAIAFGSGPVTITGTGGDNGGSGGTNYGVYVQAALAGGGAPISITGTGGNSSGNNNAGIFQQATISNTGAGSISLNGTGGGSGSNEYGYFAIGNTTAGTGNIAITGVGSAASLSGSGIATTSNAISTGGSGTITLNGTGAGNSGSASIYGVYYSGTLTAVDGLISITGVSNATGASSGNDGVLINTSVTSTGLGGISLTGVGGGSGGGGSNYGVTWGSANSIQSTGGGAVTIAGTGGLGTAGGNYGVFVQAGLAGSGGAISITGNSSIKTVNSYGIYQTAAISNTGAGNITLAGTFSGTSGGTSGAIGYYGTANVTAVTGNIAITGTSSINALTANDYGIYLTAGTISTGGAGTITLTGNGGGGSVVNDGAGTGVLIDGGVVTATDGLIRVTGTGSRLALGYSLDGVLVQSGAIISTGLGGINIQGTGGGRAYGGNSYGVTWNTDGIQSTGGGAITITGIGGGVVTNFDYTGGHYGVYVQAPLVGSGGAITITGTGGPSGGDNNVGIYQAAAISNTGAGSITLNGTGGGGDLTGGTGAGEAGYISSASVTAVSGNISIIGKASSLGAGNGLELDGGADISTGGSGTITLSGTATADAPSAASIGFFLNGGSVTAANGLISITGLNNSLSTADGNVGANLASGSVQVTGSGGITVTGTGGGAGGTGAGNIGVNIGGPLSANGGAILITGTGGNSSGDGNFGISQTAAISTTGAGGITLNGTGGGTGANEDGYFTNANVAAGTGNIAITGLASATAAGNLDYGIYLGGTSISTGGAGTITLAGTASGSLTGGPTTGVLFAGAFVTAVDGLISVTGVNNSTGSGPNNSGIRVLTGSISSTGLGGVTLNGTGGLGAGNGDYGVWLNTASAIQSLGGGPVTVIGHGGSGSGGSNSGVVLDVNDAIHVAGATPVAITLTGTGGGSGAGSSNYGVDIDGTLTGNGGAIAITGNGGDAAGSGDTNWGVYINSTLSAGGGPLSITGTGGNASGVSNSGIKQLANIINTGAGNITLNGTAGGTGAAGRGYIGSANITAGTGNIAITGFASPVATGVSVNGFSNGIEIGGNISTTGSGTITLAGAGTGGGTGTGSGVFLLSGSVTAVNGLISVTGISNSTGNSSGNDGVVSNGVIKTTGLGGVTISGTAGGTGASGSDVGVSWSVGGGIQSGGGGAISITGIGGDNGGSGSNNYGVNIGAPLNANGGAILVTGTGGNSSGNGNVGIEQPFIVTNTGSGSITLNGTGGGTGGGEDGYDTGFNPGANITAGTGNISITGIASATATQAGGNNNIGIVINGGAISTAGSGTITLAGTATSNATGGGAGILLAFGPGAVTIAAVDGLISITGIDNSTYTGAANYAGLQIGVATIKSSGLGGVTLNGTAGGAGGTSGDNGVNLTSTSSVQSTGGGTITITGTGGDNGGSGANNYGVNIAGSVAGSGAILITGTGGNSSGANNYGINQTAAITNTGAGSITLNGTSGGSGSNEVGYLTSANVTAGTGNIAITGTASPTATGTGNGGIIFSGGTTSTGGAGTITLLGTATGTGTGTEVGTDVNGGTITAVNGLISVTGINNSIGSGNGNYGVRINSGTVKSTGIGGVTVNGTGGGSGAATTAYGVNLNVANAIQSLSTGAITITGTGGDNGGSGTGNNGVQIAGVLAGNGGAILITGTGGNSSGVNNNGINQTAAITNTGAGSITLNGTGGGSGVNKDGYFTTANVTAATGNIAITGTAGAAGSGVGIAVGSGTISTTGAGTITLSSITTAASNSAISLSSNAVKAVDGLISITGINNSTSTALVQAGLLISNVNSIVSTGTGGISLTGTAGGTGASGNDYGVTWSAGSIAFGSGPITITGTGGDVGGTGGGNYGVYVQTALAGSGSAISITGTGGGADAAGSNNSGINQSAAISNTGAGNITLNGSGVGTGGIGVAIGGNITAGSGNISITGTTSASLETAAANTYGVADSAASIATGGAGTITITGIATGSGIAGTVMGFYVNSGVTRAITAVDGLISITGTNNSTNTGSSNIGLYAQGLSVTTTGLGGIKITGTGGGTGAGGFDTGVMTATSDSFSSTGGGAISISGTGGDNGGSGIQNWGASVFGTITGSGPITFTGTGGNSNAGSNYGVYFGATLNTSGNLTINATGSGTGTVSGGNGNYGILILNTAAISSTGGNIAITGISGGDALASNYGINNGSSISTTGSGTITLNGTVNGSGAFSSFGVASTGAISSVDGLISITGTNNSISTSAANDGVQISVAGVHTSGAGGISISGTGGGSGAGFNEFGVSLIVANAVQATGSGAITITGTGGDTGGTGASNWGVNITQAISANGGAISITGTGGNSNGTGNNGINQTAAISNTGAGSITLNGTGGGIGTGEVGYLTSANITAGTGNISITGTASLNANGSGNGGIIFSGGTTSTHGAGTITIIGTATGTGAGSEVGADVNGGTITAVDGLISVTGINNSHGSGSNNTGVRILSGTVKSTGLGGVTVNGTGGGLGAGSTDYGVNLNVAGGIQSLSTGAITITGTGGGGSGGSDNGVQIFGALAGNGGAISITGSGGNSSGASNFGIDVLAPVTNSGSGSITFNGTGGGTGASLGNTGVMIGTGGSIQATGSGAITLTGIGGDNGGSGLGNAGVGVGQLVSANGGDILITGSGGNSSGVNNFGISQGGSITNTGTGSITLNGTGGGTAGFETGIFVGASNPNTTAGTGNISLTGVASAAGTGTNNNGITLPGGGTISTGGAGTITIAGTGAGTGGGVGIQVNAGTVTAVNGLISVTGISNATGTGDNNIGVAINLGSFKSTGSGGVTVTGTGGGTGASSSNYGVYSNFANGIQSTGTGPITITGTGGDNGGSGGNNYGVYIAQSLAGNGAVISITGGGGNSSGAGNIGIQLDAALSTSQDISLSGTGGGTGTGETGISALSAGTITGRNVVITGSPSAFGAGSALSLSGVTSTGAGSTITLFANGAASAGALFAGGLGTLDLEGLGGAFTLTDAGNIVSTLTGNTGSVTYAQPGSLSVTGLSAGNIALSLTGTGNLTFFGFNSAGSSFTASTVNGSIVLVSGATLFAAGSGDALVLKAGVNTLEPTATGGDFVNNAGASALVTPNGNWLVYSGHKPGQGTVDGGLTNYTLQGLTDATYTPATGTNFLFVRAPLTVNVTASLTGTVIKTYDGTLIATLGAGNYQLTGVSPADQSVVILTVGGVAITNPTSGVFAGKNVGSGLLVTVSGLGLNQPVSTAYVLTATTIAANIGTINPASLTISAANDNRLYDGTTASSATPTVGTLYSTDTVSGLAQAFASRNALGVGGSTLIVTGYTVNDGNSGANYAVNLATAIGTITPASLTITAANDSKVYDGTISSAATPIVGTLYGTDTVTGLAQAFDSRHVLGTNGSALNVHSYVLNDGNGGANYTVALTSATGTITPAALTLLAANDNKDYDGTTDSSGVATAGALYGTDTVSGLAQSFGSKNVLGLDGSTLNVTSYTVNDGNAGADYAVNLVSAPGTITPAILTLQAVSDVKVYDGTDASSATPTYTGLVSGDSLTGLTQVFIGHNAGITHLRVAAYSLSDPGNYDVHAGGTALGQINQATLTLSAVSDTKTYDGTTDSNATPTYTGLIAADAGNLTDLTQAFGSRNVLGASGSTLDVTGYSLSDPDNYTVNLVPATGTIAPATLFIDAVSDTKVYDSTKVSSATPTYSGLVSGDSLTGLIQAFTNRSVGISFLQVTGYSLSDPGNYDVHAGGIALGQITPATLTISAVSDTKTYDGTTASSATPIVGTLYGTDTVTGLAQAFASKNALGANGSILNVTGYLVHDGNGGGNYIVTPQSALGTINPAALTITAANDSKVYDGTTASSATPTVGTLYSTDTVSGLAQAFASRNALGSGGSTLIVTGYTVNDGNGGANYAVNLATAIGTITPASLTITAANDSKVYDGTISSSATPIVGTLYGTDTVSGLSQVFDSRHVLGTNGSALNVNGYSLNDGNGGANYTVALAGTTGTITPAALTLIAANDSKVYDGTTASSGIATTSPLYGTDTLSGLVQSFASKDVLGANNSTLNVTSYTVNDGNAGADYAVNLVSAPGTITPASLTISATSETKTYDNTVHSSLTPTYTGLVSGDSLTGLSQLFTSRHVAGTNGSTLVVASYSLTSALDYNVVLNSALGTINPATLTIAAVSDSKTYDGTNHSAPTPTYTGLQLGDNLTGLFQVFTSRHVAGTNGSTLVVGGFGLTDALDYNVVLNSAPGTISQATLTISATSDSKTYDGTVHSAQTPTYTGLQSGDSLTGLIQAFTSKDVAGTNGSSLVVAGFGLTDALDYHLVLNSAPGTINPATLFIDAVSDTKVYDGTKVSSATPTYSGLVSGDSLTGLVQAFTNRNAGISFLQVTGYSLSDPGNYDVHAGGIAVGLITPAALTISAVSDTKTYDGTTASSATPTTGTLYGTDTVTGLAQAFASKDALGANGSTLNVASYLVHDGNGGGNYIVTLHSATGTINPAALTITAANDNRVYDGTTGSSATPIVGTLYSTDTVSGLSQAFASKNVLGTNGSTLNVTSYTVNDGNGGADYTVSLVSVAGSITPAALTITAANDSKTYDGTTTSAAAPTVGTLYSTDSVTGLSQAFASKDVLGTNGSTLNVTAYSVNDGNGGADYAVIPVSAAGTISPATLFIDAVSDTKVYDGTKVSSAMPTYSGLVSGDSLTGLIQAFTNRNAGISFLQVTGYSLSDPGNYDVHAGGIALGQITPAALTINAVSDVKVYDGTAASSATPTTGTLYGTDTVTGLAQAFASKNALGANGSTLNVTGYLVHDGNSGGNYIVTLHSATGTINPVALTISATSSTRTYDGTTASAATPATGTLYGSDTVTGLAQAFASKDALGTNGSTLNVTGYLVHDGNSGLNYIVTLQSAHGTITPAPLTLSAVSQSKVYDGTTASSGTPTAGALYGSDTVTGLSQAFASKNVLGANGSTLNVAGYTIHDGNGGADYAVTLHGATGTISPAALTISAVSDSKVYDATTASSLTPAVAGLKTAGGDTVSGLSQAFASKDVKGTNGSLLSVVAYTLNDGNSGHNYSVTLNTATGTITAATLSYDANSVSRTYGSSNPALSGILAGLKGSDTQASVVNGTLVFTTSATSSSNAGSYAITGSGLTVKTTNYAAAIGQDAGNATALTINPATLTYTANSASRIYGAANPSFSGTLTGYVLGQNQSSATTGTLSFTSATTTASNAGSYAINGGGLTAKNGNYVFVQAAGNATALTINPATLTYTAAAASRGYGAADPTYTGTVSGFVMGQNLAGATTGSLAFITSATAASNVGHYAINGSGLIANNGNYVFVQASGNAAALTINPATLTYVANSVDRTYGASNPALTGTVTGYVLGQNQASATTGTLAFTTSATASSNVGDYAINGSGLTAKNGNYVFAQAAGNATALGINPATLTYVANSADRDYGDSNPSFSGTVTGFVLGQNQGGATTGSLHFTSTATASSNAGDYAITGSGLTAKNGNYVFVQAAGNATALSIDPATLYYAADITIRPYGANNPSPLLGNVIGFVLGQTQASATTGTLTFTTTATASSWLGFYPITGSGLTANSGNYVFAQAPWNGFSLIVSPFNFNLTFDVTKGQIVGFDLNNNHNDDWGLLSLLWFL